MISPVKNFSLITGKQSIMALALCGCLGLFGCSSSGNGGGDVAADPAAFNFNAGNAEIAAEIAAAAMEFFPEYTKVAHQVLGILVNGDPNASPFNMSNTLCSSGTATLTWSDTDTSGDLSVGDSASLQFTGCGDGSGEAISGTVDIAISSVVANLLDITVGHTVALNLTISSATDTVVLSANFRVNVNTPDGGVSFTADYTAADTAGQTLTITENGTEYLKLGCFDVHMIFTDLGITAPAASFNISPDGVINASNQIISLASISTIGVLNGVVNSGTERLLSVAQPDCGAVGVPSGVGDSDGSYMDMVLLGGGDLQLVTYDANDNETSSLNTTWDLLTN